MTNVNCRISLQFDNTGSEPVFNYVLENCSPGWQVSQDGNIRPPTRERVIRIRINSPAKASVYGLRLSTSDSNFPRNPEQEPYFNDTDDQAQVLPSTASNEVTFELEDQHQVLYYQFGILVDGEIFWDDPRVYNDGSQ